MKVILLQNVPGLGKADEVKDAAEGYAINFLFPKHLAVQASTQSLTTLKQQKDKRAKDEIRDLQIQQTLAERLDGLEINLKEKASAAGILYAAVGPKQICDALAKLGHEVDKAQIIMAPIKSAGDYEATVKLRHGLEAKVSISVSV